MPDANQQKSLDERIRPFIDGVDGESDDAIVALDELLEQYGTLEREGKALANSVRRYLEGHPEFENDRQTWDMRGCLSYFDRAVSSPASSRYGPDAGLEFPDDGGEPETKEA